MLGNWGEERLVSTVHACAASLGNLETTVILVRVAWPYITETRSRSHLQDTALFNQAAPYALGKVGKWMVLRTNNWQQYSTYITARMCLSDGYIRPSQIYLRGLTVCIMLRVHFGKAEAAYCHSQTSKPWPCMILESYIYFTEYLSVLFQLTYLDELYGECNWTARKCVNSGYQALFTPWPNYTGLQVRCPNMWIAMVRICALHTISNIACSLVPRPQTRTRNETILHAESFLWAVSLCATVWTCRDCQYLTCHSWDLLKLDLYTVNNGSLSSGLSSTPVT